MPRLWGSAATVPRGTFGVEGGRTFSHFDNEHDLGYFLEVVQPPRLRREPELIIP